MRSVALNVNLESAADDELISGSIIRVQCTIKLNHDEQGHFNNEWHSEPFYA